MYTSCHPSSQQQWESLNCSDHKLTQLLINRPVAVPSTRLTVDSIFQEFVDQMCRVKTRQTSCCQDDLSSHRSIGIFILTIDSQYNASGEIIPTWNLTICMTYCAKILANYICIVSIDMMEETKQRLVFVFLGLPKYAIRIRYALDEKLIIGEEMPEPDLHIPRWPLDQSEYSLWSS